MSQRKQNKKTPWTGFILQLLSQSAIILDLLSQSAIILELLSQSALILGLLLQSASILDLLSQTVLCPVTIIYLCLYDFRMQYQTFMGTNQHE